MYSELRQLYPAMDVEGALRIWHRSESRFGLRYTKIISDEDSKAFSAICIACPYGEPQIIKYECMGRVQKCVGGYLGDLKK